MFLEHTLGSITLKAHILHWSVFLALNISLKTATPCNVQSDVVVNNDVVLILLATSATKNVMILLVPDSDYDDDDYESDIDKEMADLGNAEVDKLEEQIWRSDEEEEE